MTAVGGRNRFKEALLALAAGHAMAPLGDNRAEARSLAEQIWKLRKAEAGLSQGRVPSRLPFNTRSLTGGIER